jgi:2-polyprenyl-3-methyl-5-hydroxy-6-metoxy-1,4-benzoquinol methylase
MQMNYSSEVCHAKQSWCALCEQNVYRIPVYFKPNDSQFTVSYEAADTLVEGWILSRCQCCGLVSVDQIPDAAELGTHYNSDYYAETILRGQIADWMIRKPMGQTNSRWPWSKWSQQRAHNQEIQRLKNLSNIWGSDINPKPYFLDIGCGTGEVLIAAHDLGWITTGVEISGAAAEQARNASNCTVICSPLEEVQLKRESFDIVHLREVLEHIRFPADLLRQIASWLRPGGIVYIQVPNDLLGYRFRLFGKRWWIFPPIHLHYFTQQVLVQKLSNLGLELIEAGSFANAIGADLRRFLSWRFGILGALDFLQNGHSLPGIFFKVFQVFWDHVLFTPVSWVLRMMNLGFTFWIIARKNHQSKP